MLADTTARAGASTAGEAAVGAGEAAVGAGKAAVGAGEAAVGAGEAAVGAGEAVVGAGDPDGDSVLASAGGHLGQSGLVQCGCLLSLHSFTLSPSVALF